MKIVRRLVKVLQKFRLNFEETNEFSEKFSRSSCKSWEKF